MLATRPTILGRRAVIAAGHHLATAAGLRIYAAGGNAADAAAAAGFALAVLKPHQNGFGGECPILVHDPRTGRVTAISGQGTAPRRATAAWFRERGIQAIPGDGFLPATVPGMFGAYAALLRVYGRLSLREALAPALELAENGFPVYRALHDAIAAHAERFKRDWPSSADVYLPGGRVPACGGMLRQPALAATLRRLGEAEAAAVKRGREDGIRAAEDCFYRGEIAREIVAYAQDNPVRDATGEAHAALLEVEDFAAYETRLEEPVSADYRGWRVHKCGPWTQGPVFLQQLKILEGYDLRGMGQNSPAYLHHLVEAAKLAFADRERYYGDPLFAAVPLERLLSADHAAGLRTSIDPNRADDHLRWEGPTAAGDESYRGDTTHLDTADADGLMVSATPSGGWIPSSPVIPAVGFPLGTRGQMFRLDEAHPNGLRPGKRPRATLTPSLACRDGRPMLAFGTPGGDMQDQWTLQFFLNVADFGLDLQEAIDAPSVHTTHFPDSFYPHAVGRRMVYAEGGLDGATLAALREKGHVITEDPANSHGQVCAVRLDRERGLLEAAASAKSDGQAYAAGW